MNHFHNSQIISEVTRLVEVCGLVHGHRHGASQAKRVEAAAAAGGGAAGAVASAGGWAKAPFIMALITSSMRSQATGLSHNMTVGSRHFHNDQFITEVRPKQKGHTLDCRAYTTQTMEDDDWDWRGRPGQR